jgi:four helix bundle protein
MSFKELIVWQKSHALTLKTIKAVESINRSYAGDIIARQLLRATTSIGANIAEGYGRHEGKEYAYFLQVSYGSANEVDNWLTVLQDSGLMKISVVSSLLDDVSEIKKILVTMIIKIKEKGKGHGIKGNNNPKPLTLNPHP